VSTAFAQFETSSALGSLLDPNGAATGNARVTITNFETGVEQKAVSDNSGACQFLEVRLGRYRLAAEAAGLKRAESAEFRVDAGARQRVDMRLEIGAVFTKISVTASAALVSPEPSERGEVIGPKEIVDFR
jgi:hypothetical protein